MRILRLNGVELRELADGTIEVWREWSGLSSHDDYPRVVIERKDVERLREFLNEPVG